jgi:hypothetical protein
LYLSTVDARATDWPPSLLLPGVQWRAYIGDIAPEPLFPDQVRTDRLTQYAHESQYVFLQRVQDPVFARVRDLLNGWFERFASSQDEQAIKDLRRRLQAKGEGQFNPAFWELYLHELFARLGFEAKVHPDSERGTRPDFELTGNGTRFYLEAVAPIPHYSDGDRETASEATVIEYVNASHNPNYYLRLRHLIPGQNTPRKREVVAKVESWLDSLVWADLWKGDLASSVHPGVQLEVGDGWKIGLEAIPIERTASANPARPMIAFYRGSGGYPDGLGRVVIPYLEEKSTKYGTLDAPLVIAVWVLDLMAHPETASLALFDGWFDFNLGPVRTYWEQRVDRIGLWTPGASTRGRAAGVLATGSFDFGYPSVARSMPRYWPNAWADDPLSVELPFPTSAVSADQSEVVNSPWTIPPADLFELPEEWPGPGSPFENAYD